MRGRNLRMVWGFEALSLRLLIRIASALNSLVVFTSLNLGMSLERLKISKFIGRHVLHPNWMSRERLKTSTSFLNHWRWIKPWVLQIQHKQTKFQNFFNAIISMIHSLSFISNVVIWQLVSDFWRCLFVLLIIKNVN